ncbi:hypothetical protein C0J45_5930 [Silurus meridionalis]|nr:hypothetical protein C0J45_5930 [Silurus meridionalis]
MKPQFVGECDGLTFWLARPQDYEEVMAISQNIYHGNDYLPHHYHNWMSERDRVVIIGRRNEKLVALESGLVVDGGQTVVLEGLRVCPSERGRGVAGVIQRVTDHYIKQVYPSVTTKRFTRADNPGPEKLSKFIVLACRSHLDVYNTEKIMFIFREAMKPQFVGECDGLTFWLARPQDYDEVMAISQNIYHGNDYLPHFYHNWMSEHDRVVIIGRRNEKLVALESGLVVDGGQTVVLEGLRVCPSERGRGVAGVIQRVTDHYIKQVYPSVTTKRFTRADNPGPEKLPKFIVLACRKAKLESIKKSNKPDNNQKLFVLKDNLQLNAILLDPKLSLRLQLPGGAIIQNWQPLKLMESNLEIMKKQNLTWMFDWFEDKPMFMSFHTPPYPVPLQGGSLILNIDMFGTDVSIARNALIAHLEQVLEEIHGNVVIHIYMPQTFWESMRQFCDGHEGVKQYMYYGEQWLLEKDMS